MYAQNEYMEIPILDAGNQLFGPASKNAYPVGPDDRRRSSQTMKRSIPYTQKLVFIDGTT